MVRVGRLELPASCSQSKRATNCATPGYEIFQLWSNMGSAPVFDQFPAKGKTPSALASQSFPGFWRSAARTPASRSQTRRDTNFAIPGYSISAMIPRRRGKSKIFLSVVIPVVKSAFMPLSTIVKSPANAGVTRLCGVLQCPVPDTATALPKLARYQLRYTRIFDFSA